MAIGGCTRINKIDLLEAIGHVHVRLAAHIGRQVAAGGLSPARYRVLRFIEARAPTTAGEVRAFFGLAPRSVTEALDSLERDGLIQRQRDPADRRVSRLVILPAGIAALEASRPILMNAAEAAFAGLSPAEGDQLLALLNRVLEKVA